MTYAYCDMSTVVEDICYLLFMYFLNITINEAVTVHYCDERQSLHRLKWHDSRADSRNCWPSGCNVLYWPSHDTMCLPDWNCPTTNGNSTTYTFNQQLPGGEQVWNEQLCATVIVGGSKHRLCGPWFQLTVFAVVISRCNKQEKKETDNLTQRAVYDHWRYAVWSVKGSGQLISREAAQGDI